MDVINRPELLNCKRATEVTVIFVIFEIMLQPKNDITHHSHGVAGRGGQRAAS